MSRTRSSSQISRPPFFVDLLGSTATVPSGSVANHRPAFAFGGPILPPGGEKAAQAVPWRASRRSQTASAPSPPRGGSDVGQDAQRIGGEESLGPLRQDLAISRSTLYCRSRNSTRKRPCARLCARWPGEVMRIGFEKDARRCRALRRVAVGVAVIIGVEGASERDDRWRERDPRRKASLRTFD